MEFGNYSPDPMTEWTSRLHHSADPSQPCGGDAGRRDDATGEQHHQTQGTAPRRLGRVARRRLV